MKQMIPRPRMMTTEVPSTDQGFIRFPANSTAKQTITINVEKDDLFETNEEISITFTIPAESATKVELPTRF